MMGPPRVLVVASHPIQYLSPLYRRYAADPRIDFSVAYCSLQGSVSGIDPGFGLEVAWDVPMLEGFRWIAPRNRSLAPRLERFFGLVNPGLWTVVRRGEFDVVVCLGYASLSCWIAALSAKLSGAALVWETDAQTIRPRSGSRAKLLAKRIVVPRIYRFADGVFVKSGRGRRFIRSLHLDASRVFLIPHVVDNAFFSSADVQDDRDVVRGKWGVPDDGPVALFVGKLVPWKRPGDLIDAVAQADDVWAVFVGDGELRDQLEAQARRLGVQDRVRFHGFANQQELPGLYAAAEFLVLPSEHEPFGLVVNEAFAAGIPAVISDACGAADDLVRDAVTGFVYPVGDVHQLAVLILRLASEAHLRDSMGGEAQRLISRWGPQQNTDAFAYACSSLAMRPKGRWFRRG